MRASNMAKEWNTMDTDAFRAEVRAFFQKHYRRTLVINGVDTQTNNHDAGVRRYGFHGASHKFVAERSAEVVHMVFDIAGIGASRGVMWITAEVTDPTGQTYTASTARWQQALARLSAPRGRERPR